MVRRLSFAAPLRVKRLPQAGRVVPTSARALRARAVRLKPGGIMEWHSTQEREELLVGLGGQVHVEVRTGAGYVRRLSLKRGQSIFLTSRMFHRVVNDSHAVARYLYVTGHP